MSSRRLTLVAFAAAAALALLPLASARAQEFMAGAIKISAPWARATPGGARVAGGFVTITNTGKDADRLVGGTLAQAATVEVHEMKMDGDVMRMRQLTGGLEIKPGQTVTLKPGSFHIMFMGLKAPFKAGETINGTLVFEKAGTVNVTFKVAPVGAAGPGGDAGHGAHAPAMHDMKH